MKWDFLKFNLLYWGKVNYDDILLVTSVSDQIGKEQYDLK